MGTASRRAPESRCCGGLSVPLETPPGQIASPRSSPQRSMVNLLGVSGTASVRDQFRPELPESGAGDEGVAGEDSDVGLVGEEPVDPGPEVHRHLVDDSSVV